MADDALLQRYWDVRRSGTGVDGPCDAACRQSQQCHIISPTFDVYRACMRHLADVVPPGDVSTPGDVASPGGAAPAVDVAPPGVGFVAGVFGDHSGACIASSGRWVELMVTGAVAVVMGRGLM